MADPINTFYGDHFYTLVYNTGTFEYTVGTDLGPNAIGDDEGDLIIANGTAGDGTEAINEALTFDGVPPAGVTAGSYVGQMIAGAPIISAASLYYLVTDVAGLEGTTGFASPGTFVYPVCFAAGTHIATPAGERVVEDLQIGEMITTASGALKTVQWIGTMSIPLTRFNRGAMLPIRIKKGALGEGLPQRDLYVSRDHAFAIDGVLVNAGVLVNGTTIARHDGFVGDVIRYFHVEVQDHQLLFAEGALAETFCESGDNREKFDNAASFDLMYPDAVPGKLMAMGRVTQARQLPKTLRSKFFVKVA